MDQLVILSPREQEYLLHAVEAAVHVGDRRQFFLWTQGQLQALLPHQILIAMYFDGAGALQRMESVHGSILPASTLVSLQALAVRMALDCTCGKMLPFTGAGPFAADLAALNQRNVLIHGTGTLAGGASVFALFGLPMQPGARQAYFLELLLPYLHLALLRMPAPVRAGAAVARPLSVREREIALCLREGKSNEEIGAILGISPSTVKNHLQRIYRILDVGNRTQAVARCAALQLLPA